MKGKSLKLVPGKRYVFGRDPANAVTLDDPLTSRRHFEIRGEEKVFRLVDLESTNGTFLNDEKTESAALRVGDKIQAGDTIVSFLTDQKEETAQGLVGKTIGGYKILERVGRGGMGTVYKANQLSLNRIVAFKVLSARLLKDDKFIDRFKSEARAAGGLNHPNIVQVYDVGTDGGLHFFSMEFMDGESVQDQLGSDGKLTWEDALDVLLQSSRALIFAERKDIIHRDVKPDNLMRTSDGQVKLADLGLARKASSSDQEEGIFGTPHFISPEQAQGKEIDNRADLYSLGATAYRLLAGRTPFQGSNVKDIITQQITAEPPPLKQFSPEAPDELIAVVGKLMEKEPDDRYENAEQLGSDLEKIRLKYHLKVTGNGGGGKGVLVAVLVAFLAVVGVLAYALSQGNGDGNGNNGDVIPLPPPPTTQAPAQIPNGADAEKLRESQAQVAFFEAESREREVGVLSETALPKKDAWLSLAADYDKVAGNSEFENTKGARKATARAERIRKTIQEKEDHERATLGKAEKFWNTLRVAVNSLLEKKKFAEALEKIAQAKKQPEMKLLGKYLSSAKEQIDTWTSTAKGSIAQRFETAWTQIKREAEALRADGNYTAGMQMIRAFLETAAGKDRRPPFGPAFKEADEIRLAWRAELKGLLEKRLAADRLTYFRATLAVRHHADSPGVADEAPNPVFDFDFAAAAAVFDGLATGSGTEVTTGIYREAVGRKAARYRRMDALIQTLVDRFNNRELLDKKMTLPARLLPAKGVTIELDGKRSPVATKTKLHLRKIVKIRNLPPAESPDSLEFKELSAAELWHFIFLDGGRFEMSPENFGAAALMLVEMGVTKDLERLIDAAGDTLTPEERERLRFELAAIRAWDKVIAATKNRPPEEWSVAVEGFVEKYSRSDWFILVYGYDRPGDRSLLSPAAVKAWLAERLKALD